MTSPPVRAYAARPSRSPNRCLALARNVARVVVRPSVRLKTALYALSLFITLIVILALNAAHITSIAPTQADSVLNTAPSHDSPADSGEGKDAAQGKDAHLVDEEIQRSFEEPSFELLNGLQPSGIGCDVPLDGLATERGILVFLGIFSGVNNRDRRDLYRKVILPDFPSNLFTINFILGLPPLDDEPPDLESINGTIRAPIPVRAMVLEEIEAEMEEYGDMVMLPVVDNIDLGKTHEYFKWIAKEFSGSGRVKGRPRFIMKSDDDTILVMPNIVSAFRDLDCSTNVFWGTSAGRSGYFGEYFRGLAYAMSWPLASWIGNANMPLAHTVKIEDARTGQWLRHLDTVTDPVRRIDMGWMLGDWNQVDVSVETVALHWCKLPQWVEEQHDRLLQIWSDAERPYSHEHGIAPRLSISKGRITPPGVEKEHQRQKALGWDVQRNVMNGDYSGLTFDDSIMIHSRS